MDGKPDTAQGARGDPGCLYVERATALSYQQFQPLYSRSYVGLAPLQTPWSGEKLIHPTHQNIRPGKFRSLAWPHGCPGGVKLTLGRKVSTTKKPTAEAGGRLLCAGPLRGHMRETLRVEVHR